MPLKKHKIAEACRVMKRYGISEVQTKAALKKLLELYENKWELIADEDYRVLLEVILDQDPEKEEVKSMKKEASSNANTEAVELPMKRIYKRQKQKQALLPTKSSLETTPSRKAHANDDDLLSHSSDEESQPLRRFSLKHQEEEDFIRESKGVTSKNKDAPSYNKRCSKRLCTGQQKKEDLSLPRFCLETSPSRSAHPNDNDMLSDSSDEESEEEESKGVKSKGKGDPSYDKTEVFELPTKKLYTRHHEKQQWPFSNSCWETTSSRKAHQNDDHMLSDSEEPEECQLLLRRTNRKNQEDGALGIGNNMDPVHNCNPVLVENSNPICLDTSSDSDACNTDRDKDNIELLEVEPLDVDYTGRVSNFSLSDISSLPPKGEVKIPLICYSSPQYDSHLQNFDAAPEVVDERCIILYGNGECFLAIGNDSTVDETRFRDAPDLKISSAQDVLARRDDHQGNNCSTPSLPSEIFLFQNLFKIVPHMPKHIAFSGLECLNHLTGFTIEDIEKVCPESAKRLRVLQGSQSLKSCKVEAAQNHHSSFGVVKSCVYIDDITRGEERVKISLEDGRNVEDLPTFVYIPRNVVFKNAYVKFALARISDESCCPHCYGDCLASPIPCICAIGGFAYTPGGLVKDKFLEDCISMKREPKEHHYFYCKDCPLENSKKNKSSVVCKGHLLQRFIKECWSKCRCNRNCGNRIVQRGITVKLQVFLTPKGKGWGVRALEDLPRGAFVCEYVGEIVTNTELYERNIKSAGKKHTYPVLLDADWGSEGVLKDEEALCLDATVYGNVARFINHRCFDAPLIDIPVEVETPVHHYYHVAFFTTRNVAAMEELTWDYGLDFYDRDHPVKAFRCLCGSPFCRGRDV